MSPVAHRLTMAERIVLEDLHSEAVLANGAPFPYPATKAEALDISPATLSRCLRKFRKLDLVRSSTTTAPGKPITVEVVGYTDQSLAS